MERITRKKRSKFAQFRTEDRKTRMEKVLQHRQPDLTVIAENIHDPHNVSAILRTADAVGLLDIHLIYTNEIFPKMGEKSSTGIKKWMHLVKHKNAENCVDYLHKNGYTVLATELTKNSKSIYDVDFTKQTAIAMGNEHRGVSEEILELADEVIYIPMFGLAQSLNVSVATAVILYEALRQRQQSGMYEQSKLDDNQFEALLNEWLQK